MDTQTALQAKKDAEGQCLRMFSALIESINGWEHGRRAVAEVIAEYHGWTAQEVDQTFIQPSIDALEEYNKAHEALLESLKK